VSWWKRKLLIPVWVWLVMIVVGIGAVGAITGDKSKEKDADIATTAPAVETAEPTSPALTTAPATPTSEASTIAPTTVPRTTLAATTSTRPVTTTSSTTPPTTDVATTAAPQQYQGRGDDVVDVGANTRYVLHAVHDGRRNFIVEALDSDLQTIDYPVNEIGPFDGVVLVNASGDAGDVHYLKVQADGNWTLELLDVTALSTVGDAFDGTGDQVVLYQGTGGVFALTHDGERNFIVLSITGSDANYLVNEIGAYDGRVPIPGGPALIAVTADGHWTFAKS
jgi:hypothetical protein